MTKKLTITAVLKAMKITRGELARLAGVDVSTVCRWENKGIPEKGSARALIERLASEDTGAAQ